MAWPPVTHADVTSRITSLRSMVGGPPAVTWPPVTHTAVTTEISSLRTALGGTAPTPWPPTTHQGVTDEVDALWTLAGSLAPTIAYPANAGFVNIKNAPYNPKGDGVTDDTAAIQQALNDWDWIGLASDPNPTLDRSSPKTIFFPAGTYRVTASLVATGSTIRLVGAGESLTTIRLSDNNANFQTGTSGYLLRTGEALQNGQENAGFANYISNLTLDVGAGNPAAIGCRYSVANNGSMRNVTIRSSDATKRGLHGLMFGTSAGSGYVSDVTIDGFDNGIHSEGNNVNDIVFVDVTLTNQRMRAVNHTAKCLVFENLSISGTPRGIDVTDINAMLMVDGLTMTGPGSGTGISLLAGVYGWVRDVTASGWTNLITQGSSARFSGRTSITEWASANYRRGGTSTAWGENSAYVSLRLPKTRAPRYEQYDLTKWKCPQDFGYTSGDVGPALQQAIDSGAEVVYLPYANYTLSSAVTIRGSVRKLEGMFSVLTRGTGGSLTIGSNTAGNPIIVQDLVPTNGMTLTHNSTNVVVISDIGNRNGHIASMVATGAGATGDLYVESTGASSRIVIDRPITASLRCINRERAALTISGGASVRFIGDNVELSLEDVEADTTVTGSTFELLGAAFDLVSFMGAYPSGGKAAFASTSSTVSIITGGYHRSSSMDHWVSEGTNHIYDADTYIGAPGTNERVVVPLYRSP